MLFDVREYVLKVEVSVQLERRGRHSCIRSSLILTECVQLFNGAPTGSGSRPLRQLDIGLPPAHRGDDLVEPNGGG